METASSCLGISTGRPLQTTRRSAAASTTAKWVSFLDLSLTLDGRA